MPHVTVKLWPGKSEQTKNSPRRNHHQKRYGHLHYGEESVSVAMEEVQSQDGLENVYKPDVKTKSDMIYKKPRYDENDR
jgi:4-oxalocrotonate tautomerase